MMPYEYVSQLFDGDMLNYIVEQFDLFPVQTNPNQPLNLTRSELQEFLSAYSSQQLDSQTQGNAGP